MVYSVFVTATIIFSFWFLLPVTLFSVALECWLLLLLLAFWLFGMRALVIGMPVCWVILTAQWQLEDRLQPDLEGQDILISGHICAVPASDQWRQRLVMQTDVQARRTGLPRLIRLDWYDLSRNVNAGEHWQFRVRLQRPRGTSNPGAYDQERGALLAGIGARGYVRTSALNKRLNSRATHCRLSFWRQQLAQHLQQQLGGHSATGLVLALSVGIRSQLSAEQWSVLRTTGTAHLVAISGLHIGLLAACGYFIGRFVGSLLLLAGLCRQPLAIGRGIAITMAVMYSGLAGFSLPTLRALLMTAAALIFMAQRCQLSASVIFAGTLYSLFWLQPTAMLAPGFWLSFGAVGLLILAGKQPWRRTANPLQIEHWTSRIKLAVRAQTFLCIGMLPMTALFFGQVFVIAPVANLLIVPLFGLCIIPLLVAAVLLLLVWPAIGSALLEGVASVLAAIMQILTLMSDWSVSALPAPAVHSFTLFGGVLIALLLLWPAPVPRRAVWVCVLTAMSLWTHVRNAEPELRVVVMDVGQGLAVLVQTAGYSLLYDAGPAGRTFDAGRSIVLPVLRHFGVSELDALVVSHGDADHLGGAASVLAAFPDATLIATETFDLRSAGFIRCRAGQAWAAGGVRFSMLHPQAVSRSWSDNDGSCVLAIESLQGSVLLTGDIEYRAEAAMSARQRWFPVNLVVAPHHGSRTSSTLPFIRAVQPDYVVFASGYRNRWGFPHSEVKRRWQDSGACLLVTGLQGALIFEARAGQSLQLVRQHRLAAARVWTEAAPPVAACSPVKPIN